MNVKSIVVAGYAVAALMLPIHGVLAQEATGEGAATTTEAAVTPEAPARNPQDNWLKVCEPLESGQKACVMRQVVTTNGQFLGSFLLRNDPGFDSRLMAVGAVPLGVLLPGGLTLQIDQQKPIRVPYLACDPQSCVASVAINEAYISSLKKGAVLKLIAKARSAQQGEALRDLVVEINLSGFTAVYDNDTALTFDQLREQESGASALEQQLQDRAEELRRQLDGAATEAPPAQ